MLWKSTTEVAIGFAISSNASWKGQWTQPYVNYFYPSMTNTKEKLFANIVNTNGKSGNDLTTTTPATTTNVKLFFFHVQKKVIFHFTELNMI